MKPPTHAIAAATPSATPALFRCAIYTRKSTTEGLDSGFSTLDNQRESAELFVRGRAAQGWRVVPDRFDDGGFTGANIERPALVRLLDAVKAGEIDVIVVYKVDRLSRSLLNFATILDLLERHNVGLVSITQQFDTTTSLGRFTLNMLLTFAQFEREMIAERTRDKIHGARRKGKWTGGVLPLGYDLEPGARMLVVNTTEAALVRRIFRMYLDLGSTVKIARALNAEGVRTKGYRTTAGLERPGHAWDKQLVSRVLRMRLYVGEIGCKGAWFPGEHEAIIDRATFDTVGAKLGQASPRRAPSGALERDHRWILHGLLTCAYCERAMTPSSTDGKRYRSYRCNHRDRGATSLCPNRPVPAAQVERLVVERLRAMLHDNAAVGSTLTHFRTLAETRAAALDAEHLAAEREREAAQHRGLALLDTLRSTAGRGGTLVGEALGRADLEVANLEARVLVLRTQADELRRRATEAELLRGLVDSFYPVWQEVVSSQKRRILTDLIERVVIDTAKGGLEIHFRPELAGELTIDAATGAAA